MMRRLISTTENTQLTIYQVQGRSIQFQLPRRQAKYGATLIATMRTLTCPVATMRIDSSTLQPFRILRIWSIIMEEVITSVEDSGSKQQDLVAMTPSPTTIIVAPLYWIRSIRNRRLLINSKQIRNRAMVIIMFLKTAKIGQQTTKAKSCHLPSNLLSRSHLDAIALRKRPRIQRRNEQQKPLDTKKMYRLFHSKRHLLYCRDNFSSRNISNKTLLLHPKFTNNEGQIITHSLRGVLMKSKGALELTGRVAIWVVKTRPCADDPPFQLLNHRNRWIRLVRRPR